MSTTTSHRIFWNLPRPDEDGDMVDRDVEIHYSATGGCAPSGRWGPPERYDPGEGPEFVIDHAKFMDGTLVYMTDDEMLAALAFIDERHEPEE